MQQSAFFPELLEQKTEAKEVKEKTFPKMSLENLLSDRFIEENGMLGIRMLLKRANKEQNWEKYQTILAAEISLKKGENTIKNHLRHLILSDIIS